MAGKIIIRVIIIGGLGILPFIFVMLSYHKTHDAFYWKSTHKAPSLILGGSRALKGIAPQILEEELNHKPNSILNFAFVNTKSPFGEPYYQLTKRKIARKESGSIFILSVVPMSIMDFKNASVGRETEFKFYDMWFVNVNPNIEYLLRNPRSEKSQLYKILRWYNQDKKDDKSNRTITHSNGWSETIIYQGPKQKRSSKNLIKYELEFSKERKQWLERTIEFLSGIGKVYLVRMPVSSDMLEQEEALFPEFNLLMQKMAKRSNVWYLDWTKGGDNYQYSDGHHHLSSTGARAFTTTLAETIKELD